MIKIHTRLLKRLLALGFMCFIANQALAYEKSGFFVGIQGGTMGQEKTITDTQYNANLKQTITGGTTTHGIYTQKSTSVSFGIPGTPFRIPVGGTVGKWFGAGSSSYAGIWTELDSAINLEVDTKFTKNIQIVPDQPYSVGGVIGYKKIFSSGLNAKQYVGTNLTNHASGMRYYIAYDISAKGKKSAYSSTMVNANIDFLYNLFPDYNYFDIGGFLGVSVGWVKHRTSDYEVSGVDYGINFGVRWTIHSKHTIELFGRYGLSTLERRIQNSHSEYYINNNLSSVKQDNSVTIGGSSTAVSESDKVIVGDEQGNPNKKPVQIYYGNDTKVYYQTTKESETLYTITDTVDGVNVFEVCNKAKGNCNGKQTYAVAWLDTPTRIYTWGNVDGKKRIYVGSTQSTSSGGRIEATQKVIQEYRSFPIDTIEEFRNPMRFGIRYTYTF